MSNAVQHIQGTTFHGRKGEIENAFRYSVDYVLLDAEADAPGPMLFARNRPGMFSLRDRDHGGALGNGQGAVWVRNLLADGFDIGSIQLLAQPRVFGHVFNPVSFWLVFGTDDTLRAVIAEVTNTYGDRHSYLCQRDDGGPITREDTLQSTKIFHVSPFQAVEGGYAFRFDINDRRIGIWIDFTNGDGGLLATLTGKRQALTNRGILSAMLRRPFGSRRVLGLIHWQALKLWWKGAVFRARPEPPAHEVSR